MTLYIFRYDTHTTQEPGSLFWHHSVMSFHLCPLTCLQRQFAKLGSRFFYHRSSLLRNKNMATNLQRFTSS